MESYELIKDFIATLGFPIFVAVFVLTRLEKRLDKQAEEQNKTNVVLAVLVNTMDVTDEVTPPPEEELNEGE